MADHIVDACCLINLYASGKVESIIPACSGDFYVSEQVRSESLKIRQPDENDPESLVLSPINLSDAIASGLFKECFLTGPAELDAYVRFAVEVEDGEASCLAIAESRSWSVVTDDRKAHRLASDAGISVVTTPELIEQWATATRPFDDEVTEVLRCIERYSRFRPRRSSPLYEWWVARSDP
jgi:hypothetical protein